MEQIHLSESQFNDYIREAVGKVLHTKEQRTNLLAFARELSQLRNKCYDLACNFEGIEQDVRQELVSIAKDFASLRYRMFNSNTGLTPWDDEEHKYEPMFDED